MDGERIESAVQRIEQALARIAAQADAERGSNSGEAAVPPNVSQLVVRHEELREAVTGELKRLDDLIGKLES
ncbi:hypothetical protein [Parerythrobacter jejuensis]|uniref:Uncharacterized protein n=1 Tax=Parerythrobacter jejuensis TaxID=795812 RepID=A0A845ASQ8_9SPHN|nr:hypothetical protein [Parerythrobacter jejuensis]MXP32193.1 hypothetical protein [Parerythrobacter jejuensis]